LKISPQKVEKGIKWIKETIMTESSKRERAEGLLSRRGEEQAGILSVGVWSVFGE
jgi:hypothetical protein